MAQMVQYGNELIRINFAKNSIEYSTNNGCAWHSRFSGSSYGIFKDFIVYGDEIIAITSKGIYYSTNKGCAWHSRFSGSSYGNFLSLAANGSELLAQTDKGLFYSTNKGCAWHRRG